MSIMDTIWLYFVLSTHDHLVADAMNAAFESAAGIMIWLHVRRAFKDRAVKGVSVFATVVFTAWGFFNIIFYPYAGLWISGFAALMPAIPNCVWVYCMWKFRERDPSADFAKGFRMEDAKRKGWTKPLNTHHAANPYDAIPSDCAYPVPAA